MMFRIFFFIFTFMSTQALATDWKVQMDSSKLGFVATQVGAEFEGEFKKFESRITFDPADLTHSVVKITILIDSVDTQSAERDSNIVSSDWFDTANHPTALFETKVISSDGKGGYLADAELTMRGVKQEVKLPFTVEIKGTQAHAKGELIVQRTAFGIGQGQWVETSIIGDDVRIFFDLKSEAK